MQEQTLASGIANFTSEVFVAVFRIASNRMPSMQRMHTNLMGAPSNRLGLDQGGEFTKTAQHTKDRQRLFTLIIDLNHALTGTQGVLQQWRIDLFLGRR